MTSTDPVIETEDLRKEYGDTVAVADVSVTVEPEEVFALVGPNGAGKTTFVEMLECLRTPTSGSGTVLGHDLATEQRAIKERIGVVPQSFHTFERLTARENVALSRRMYDDGLAVESVLEQLDLLAYADIPFGDLSGGYQRRTGIAMALVADPDLLFLDEPTTGLDPAARRTTWEEIDRLAAGGTTVVLTTHYMEEVEQLADRAALLLDGRLVAVDTVRGLVDRYGGDVRLVVGPGEDDRDDAVESSLRAAAASVYRNENGALVGHFHDQSAALETFAALDDLDPARSIELASAGMEDVFLNLAGGTLDAGGELQGSDGGARGDGASVDGGTDDEATDDGVTDNGANDDDSATDDGASVDESASDDGATDRDRQASTEGGDRE